MNLINNKRYGFTLIELLAVIVILAIIALIATPIVLNIIKDSKESATLRSADFYLDAVEFSIAQRVLESNSIANGTYKIMKSGNICLGTLDETNNTCSDEMLLEVNGETPTSGTITIEDGEISDIYLTYVDKNVVKDEKNSLIYYKPKTYTNGEEVYYNVTTGEVCEESQAVSSTGTKIGCMKFYAFNDVEGNETVNLILDHNTTSNIAWNSSSKNKSGPKEILTALYNDTKTWVGTITPEDYTVDQTSQTGGANYTVKYSEPPSIEEATEPYKARLITAQEVAQITGADIALNWDETAISNLYYFDGAKGTDETWQTQVANSTNTSDYWWLYDRTSTDCKTYGCLNNADLSTGGYWTASSQSSNSYAAWSVKCRGSITNTSAYYDGFGVRPVIKVLKFKLSQQQV